MRSSNDQSEASSPDRIKNQAIKQHESEMRKINLQMTQISPGKAKKLQIQGDDVFADIFLTSTKSQRKELAK